MKLTFLSLLVALGVAAPSYAQSDACPSDVTGDGIVSGDDLATVLGDWSPGGCKDCAGDINGDHQVDGVDLALVLSRWGGTCAPTLLGITPTAGPTLGGTQVLISGSHLASTTAVYFGNEPAAEWTVLDQTTVLAVAPSSPTGLVDIRVDTNVGTAMLPSVYRFGPSVPKWATLLEAEPDPAVVTNATLREAVIASGLAWRVRHTASQIEMVLVPAGSFTMGCSASSTWACLVDELPNHQVTLPTGFYLGRCEVTQTQWTSVMGSNPSNGQGPNFPNAAVCPVEMVSWNSVQGFMAAMDLRLPTEAEWEYAYRAGTTTAFHSSASFPFGSNSSNALDPIAWWAPNASGKMQPVGSKSANALGLFDMSGNAAEWVNDWYSASYYSGSPSVNPTGPVSGATKVIRGGSFLNNFDRPLRSSARFDRAPGPGGVGQDTGFRVARNP